jgi:hypothetical protein
MANSIFEERKLVSSTLIGTGTSTDGSATWDIHEWKFNDNTVARVVTNTTQNEVQREEELKGLDWKDMGNCLMCIKTYPKTKLHLSYFCDKCWPAFQEHPSKNQCTEPYWCVLCSVRDCPRRDDLHYKPHVPCKCERAFVPRAGSIASQAPNF